MVYSHWLGPEPRPGRMGWLHGFNKNLSRCTWTGTRRNTGNIFRTWKWSLWRILVFFPVPVQVQCQRFLLKPYNQPILPDQCAMWKVLHNIGSLPSQCEYTFRWTEIPPAPPFPSRSIMEPGTGNGTSQQVTSYKGSFRAVKNLGQMKFPELTATVCGVKFHNFLKINPKSVRGIRQHITHYDN